jgi:hypothetical protein
MNRYRALTKKDPETRQYLSDRFFDYLLASCWRKMNERVTRWWFIGALYHLHDCTRNVEDAYKSCHKECMDLVAHRFPKANDRDLVTTLEDCFSHKGLTLIQESYLPDELKSLSELKLACIEQKHHPFTIYDESNCLQFHQLLLAILLGYVKALQGIKKNGSVTSTLLSRLQIMASVLLILTESQAFQLHITILGAAGLLQTPEVISIPAYELWATQRDLGCRGPPVRCKEKEKEKEEEEAAEVTEKEVDAEAKADLEGNQAKDAGDVYRTWIGMQVTHFGAQRVLEQYCTFSLGKEPFKLPLVLFKHTQGGVSWMGLKKMMQELSFTEDEQTTIWAAMRAISLSGEITKHVGLRFSKLLEDWKDGAGRLFHSLYGCCAL